MKTLRSSSRPTCRARRKRWRRRCSNSRPTRSRCRSCTPRSAASARRRQPGAPPRPSSSASTCARRRRAQAGRRQRRRHPLLHIIYDAVDDVKAAMSGMLAPEQKEETGISGTAEIRRCSSHPRSAPSPAAMVTSGLVRRGRVPPAARQRRRLHRRGIASAHEGRRARGQGRLRCGLKLKNYNDIRKATSSSSSRSREVALAHALSAARPRSPRSSPATPGGVCRFWRSHDTSVPSAAASASPTRSSATSGRADPRAEGPAHRHGHDQRRRGDAGLRARQGVLLGAGRRRRPQTALNQAAGLPAQRPVQAPADPHRADAALPVRPHHRRRRRDETRR